MSGGLSNADFRKLLATPRPGAGGGGGGGGEGGGEKKKHKKPGKNFKPGGKLGEKEGAKEEGPQYRDRAAERRKGLSADFEGVPDDLVGLLEGKGDARGAISYEDSKYLGGDVAHTHLVKGLDFALLQKVRAEQAAEKAKGGAGAGGAESGEEGAPQLAKKLDLPGHPQPPATFQTPLGRAVHAFFFDPAQRGAGAPVAELFQPRRTAFVYDLEEGAGAPDIPTTLRRSKEDCPKPREMALGGLDGGVLERIAKIMSYMTVAGGGRKKLKKKEREALLGQHGFAVAGQLKGQQAQRGGSPGGGAQQDAAPAAAGAAAAAAAAAAAGPADEDDDIFGDAGTDYVPTVKDKERAARAAAAAEQQTRGGYFGAEGADDLHADLPPLPRDDGDAPPPPPPEEDGELAGPAPPPSGYDAGAAYGAYPSADAYPEDPAAAEAAAAEALRKEKLREKRRAEMLSGGDDAYAECYPSYYDAGTMVEDSDDEGGQPLEQQALTRRDFASEADWEEYQASGMAPRQAEGRAKVRAQQKEASKEKSKIATQLGKIQKIMEDKGYDHAAAFARPAKKERGGGGGEGGGDEAPAAAFTKRRRI